MSDLLDDFKSESLALASQMVELLEQLEAGEGEPKLMESFGMYADRIMGAAKQLILAEGDSITGLATIAEFTQLCKLLGYKSAQLTVDQGIWPMTVAILLDATDELSRLITSLQGSGHPSSSLVAATLIDRLSWLNQQFSQDISGTVPMNTGRIIDHGVVGDLIERLKKAQ